MTSPPFLSGCSQGRSPGADPIPTPDPRCVHTAADLLQPCRMEGRIPPSPCGAGAAVHPHAVPLQRAMIGTARQRPAASLQQGRAVLRPEEGPFPFKCKSQPRGSGNTVGPAVLGTQPGGTEGRRRSSHRSVFPCRCAAGPEPVDKWASAAPAASPRPATVKDPGGGGARRGLKYVGGFRGVGSLL